MPAFPSVKFLPRFYPFFWVWLFLLLEISGSPPTPPQQKMGLKIGGQKLFTNHHFPSNIPFRRGSPYLALGGMEWSWKGLNFEMGGGYGGAFAEGAPWLCINCKNQTIHDFKSETEVFTGNFKVNFMSWPENKKLWMGIAYQNQAYSWNSTQDTATLRDQFMDPIPKERYSGQFNLENWLIGLEGESLTPINTWLKVGLSLGFYLPISIQGKVIYTGNNGQDQVGFEKQRSPIFTFSILSRLN